MLSEKAALKGEMKLIFGLSKSLQELQSTTKFPNPIFNIIRDYLPQMKYLL